ncbi:ABC transporter substrate-binding protein [Chitinophaga nivalis]|uniref:ABC transporter substrate-binding protein n=1 Tax=Chitinophaga nivalis TaxID=2991709 RepID=A0ABT3ILF0_9BACT|nr:ABC transporter substrate-binding protein [Chitinophaga nivalis]MCW3465709.1 ABC transporter substrate-binding protein [Chitinophaga nivalis]MCW3484600.1 ABC transporter substrate-binding protein [Chitinophaga nivalis]
MKCSYWQTVIFRIGLIGIIALGAGACGNTHSGQQQVFRYNQTVGLASLDPAFAKSQEVIWAVKHIYNTLVEPDSQLQIRPSLARSWQVSADHRTYTFDLRTDVYFQDHAAFPGGKGRRMTAQDVVYSLRRIMDPATASPGAWIFNGKLSADTGFRAINDSTFAITLYRPFHPILGILSMQYCSVVPQEVVEKYGKDFRNHPCGTGPFRFFFWEEGQALVLHRHPQYFEKDSTGRRLPYLDAVQISFLDSKAAEFLLFRQGKLDFMNDIDASFKDEVLTKQGKLKKEWEGRLILDKHAYLNTEYLGILTDSNNKIVQASPLRFKKVRQAINYGIDRTKMMTYLRNGIGMAAHAGFVPAGLPSFDATLVKGYPYAPEKARQLLREAGFPDGKGLPAIRLLSIPVYADLANYVANQLQEVGIRIQVEVLQKSALMEQTAKSQALFFRGSWIADYPDAESYLAMFYSKNPAPPNYTRYANPAFDVLYERALQENNDSIRYDLYRQMDRLLMADAPVVPLFYDESIHLVQPGITGLEGNGLNILELRRVKK